MPAQHHLGFEHSRPIEECCGEYRDHSTPARCEVIKDHLHQVRQGVQEPERDLVRDIVDTVEKARGINTSVTLERPCQLNIKLDEAMRDQLKFAAEQAGTSQRQLVAKLIREFLVEIQREDPRLLQKPIKNGELVAQ